MDELSADIDTSKEANEKLERLLKELGIKFAFYIDDYLSRIEFPMVSGIVRTLHNGGHADEIKEALGDDINIELPDVETIISEFEKNWEAFEDGKRVDVFKTLTSLEDHEFVSEDYDRTNKLKEFFPQESIRLISPDEWEATLANLEKEVGDSEKVLVIFDQDLSKATHDDFRSGRIQGDDLIVKIKASPLFERTYCTLITHLIPTISEELTRRTSIVEKHDGKLVEKDFFALAKIRIENPDLFCDGIKKALLNRYCEFIKEKSKEIIEKAKANLSTAIDKLDTYDFDHTILRSSYEEGVWEIETFFRIAKTMFDLEIKKEMINMGYPLSVNNQIRKAKQVSDIRFNVRSVETTYQSKYSLRHLDIYEPKEVINHLNKPLENGDIFEVSEGVGIGGFYILVAQECDLMIRSTGERSNKENRAILLKIFPLKAEKFLKGQVKYVDEKMKRRQVPHYFSNKFRLDYFIDRTDNVGIVDFLKPYYVDLDILDLAVYNIEGNTKIDLIERFDSIKVSVAWENRYKILHKKFTDLACKIDDLRFITSDLRPPGIKAELLSKYFPRISTFEALGVQECYDQGKFNFGLRRILRFRNPGASMLLDRFFQHLSRSAEPHDFASDFSL